MGAYKIEICDLFWKVWNCYKPKQFLVFLSLKVDLYIRYRSLQFLQNCFTKLPNASIVSARDELSAFFQLLFRRPMVSSNDLPVILPNFSYMVPRTWIAESFVDKLLKESSRVLSKSLHLKYNFENLCQNMYYHMFLGLDLIYALVYCFKEEKCIPNDEKGDEAIGNELSYNRTSGSTSLN